MPETPSSQVTLQQYRAAGGVLLALCLVGLLVHPLLRPVITLPGVGEMTFQQMHRTFSVGSLVLAVMAGLCLVRGWRGTAAVFSFSSAALIVYVVLRTAWRLSAILDNLSRTVTAEQAASLRAQLLDSFAWHPPALSLGVATVLLFILTVVCLRKPKPNPPPP